MNELSTKQWIQAFVIFLLASSFYLYEFALQVSPSVMTTQLMADLGLDAAGLSAAVAFYYYAYAPMQIPAGLLFDRFGPRLVMTLAIIVCALGSMIFGMAYSTHFLALGRALMGIGSACSFIGLLVLISRWFPPQYFALLAGIAQLMSSIGAIFGETILAEAVEHYSWQQTMFYSGLIGFALALLIWFVVRDHPDEMFEESNNAAPKVQEETSSEVAKLMMVLRNPQTWTVALYSFLIWAPIVVFAALWGVPYLKALYHINAIQAGAMCSLIWLGIGIGSPLFGWFSDWMGSRCVPLSLSAVIGLLSILYVMYMPGITLLQSSILMFFFGIGASGQALSFAVVKENNTAANVGTASGFNNFAVVLGGAIFQPLAGAMLHTAWDGKILHGAPVYSIVAYRHALIILPICFLAAFFVSVFMVRETKCRGAESACLLQTEAAA